MNCGVDQAQPRNGCTQSNENMSEASRIRDWLVLVCGVCAHLCVLCALAVPYYTVMYGSVLCSTVPCWCVCSSHIICCSVMCEKYMSNQRIVPFQLFILLHCTLFTRGTAMTPPFAVKYTHFSTCLKKNYQNFRTIFLTQLSTAKCQNPFTDTV